MAPKPRNSKGLVSSTAPHPINLYGLVTSMTRKPIRSGDIHDPNPCKFIWPGIYGPKPYKSISGETEVTPGQPLGGSPPPE